MARSIDKVELRGQVDKAVMDVLDACSIARGIDRISLVEKVLSDWAVRGEVKCHTTGKYRELLGLPEKQQ